MIYKFSCVVDNKPLFKAQAYIFVTSLLDLLGVAPENIFVHTTKQTNEEFYQWLRNKKVNIVEIAPFSESNPYCNKLQQLSTFQDRTDFDYVFLMDCDTAIQSLDGLQLAEAVYAKPVDFPNPPLDILRNIYENAGVTFTLSKSSFALNNKSETEINNCNGGVYIIRKDFLNILEPKWKEYANWCIENATLFTEKYSKHADQVAFGLATTFLEAKVTHLSLEFNYPTHISKSILPNIIPKIIHFHENFDEFFKLKYIGVSNADRIITKINSSIFKENKLMTTSQTNKKFHKRDIILEDLNKAFQEVERPDLLQYLVDVSRDNLGFYTSHYPRVFEYSWLLEQLETEKNGKVLDIGAGVCPLPLCLNEMGLHVTTVDSHKTIRLMKDKANWNEWGFLDYSMINPKIKSTNIDFSKYKTSDRFDSIYSISVIEHMPKKIRLAVLKKAAKLLKKSGSLFLTIDLVPNTDNLWNFSEDKEVEPVVEHGTLQTLKQELASLGFEIEHEHIQREIYNSRTDVYFVKAVLKKKVGLFVSVFQK